jgi:hypothetical protein
MAAQLAEFIDLGWRRHEQVRSAALAADVHTKILTFLVDEIARKDLRQCVCIDLLYAHGADYHDEAVRSWTDDEYPALFDGPALIEQIASIIVEVAEEHATIIRDCSRRYVVRTRQIAGGRQLCSFQLPQQQTGAMSP